MYHPPVDGTHYISIIDPMDSHVNFIKNKIQFYLPMSSLHEGGTSNEFLILWIKIQKRNDKVFI